MLESRWVRWVGPGILGGLLVGAVATAASGAASRPWAPPPCAGPGSPGSLASAAEPLELTDLASQAWFRMDPILDDTGELEGQRVSLGLDGRRSVQTVELPAESFAAGPFGGIVLLGSDDGTASRLQAVDVAGGCAWPLASEMDVIRRATIDPAGRTVYETRVDRASRADLGVWSRGLDGSAARPVLEPLPADDRFGRTFSTEFGWDPSGDILAVQACGEDACRTRFIRPVGRPARDLSDLDLGTMIGLDQGHLVSYLACPGLPCPIVSIDLTSHGRHTLAEHAGIGILASTPDGPRLVHEAFTESGLALRSVAIDGSSVADLGPIPDGLRLHPAPTWAGAATRIPSGWALLADEGRIAPDGPSDRSQLRHVPDGTSVQLDEVLP